MKTLFRVLGAAAAVAGTSIAIYALDKLLNDKGPLHVEEVEFPEQAEKDADEAAKTAEAYAEGEAKAEHTPAEPGAAWPPAFAKEENTPPEPEAPAAAPVVEAEPAEKAPEEKSAEPAQPETAEEAPAEDAIVNPVEAGPAVAPKDENGKFDVTKIAEASDFTGVEEESGCKS